jgi:hypothetical protein
MDFLYGELAPARRRELGIHLSECGTCTESMRTWRGGMTALDEWTLPTINRDRSHWPPALKWASAAAIVLCLGLVAGRQTSASSAEVAALKSRVHQLAETIEREREHDTIGATAAANAETLRLLTEYATAAQADRQAVNMALDQLESRLMRLRAELETVAVNTEDGFRQTTEGLSTLAAYTVPERSDTADFQKPESRNQ